MTPYCESPTPHVLFEKSSVKVARVERVFEFVFVSSEFVFLFVLRFETLLELFELLLLALLLLCDSLLHHVYHRQSADASLIIVSERMRCGKRHIALTIGAWRIPVGRS